MNHRRVVSSVFENYVHVSDWTSLDVPRCDWHTDDMPYTDSQRRRIAAAVRTARIAAKLDKEPAARAAEVSSITWKRVEDAEDVRDASLSKILQSLHLSPEAVLGKAARQPVGVGVVLLSQVPTLDLVDEIRRRVIDASADNAKANWGLNPISGKTRPGGKPRPGESTGGE